MILFPRDRSLLKFFTIFPVFLLPSSPHGDNWQASRYAKNTSDPRTNAATTEAKVDKTGVSDEMYGTFWLITNLILYCYRIHVPNVAHQCHFVKNVTKNLKEK